jgi:hypothetical protein
MPNENGFYSSSAAPVLYYRYKLSSILPLISSLP